MADDYRSLIGQSFDDVRDELEEDEATSFENMKDKRIRNEINRKKQFKQEKE